jgi:hypothetical protein
MPRYDSALLKSAQTAVSIVSAGELSHNMGSAAIRKEWKLARLEALYELAYLRVFAAWEAYLEAIFYRSLCGFASRSGQEKLAAGNYFRKLEDAEAAVLKGRSYLLWHNPHGVIGRCQGYFVSATNGGGPCAQETAIASSLTRLEHFAATRHRIVHDQADAKAKFNGATLHLAARTYDGSRPGKFLRDFDTSKVPQQRWLEVLVTELGSLMAQMV